MTSCHVSSCESPEIRSLQRLYLTMELWWTKSPYDSRHPRYGSVWLGLRCYIPRYFFNTNDLCIYSLKASDFQPPYNAISTLVHPWANLSDTPPDLREVVEVDPFCRPIASQAVASRSWLILRGPLRVIRGCSSFYTCSSSTFASYVSSSLFVSSHLTQDAAVHWGAAYLLILVFSYQGTILVLVAYWVLCILLVIFCKYYDRNSTSRRCCSRLKH